jgi:hypothetical protein
VKKIHQKKKSGTGQKSAPAPLTAKDLNLKAAGEVSVTHQELPPSPPEAKKIHLRRPLPPVPNAEGDESDKNQ